jgi:transcriptional regulator
MRPFQASEGCVYVPDHFRESHDEVLRHFVAKHPLAILVAHTSLGLSANHIPMAWHPAPAGAGVLRGHVARANRLWREVEDGSSVLAIFSGAGHYISPTWYPSKRIDGKAVPTWNYAAVHVRGAIRFIDEAGWLRVLVEALTEAHEAGRPDRWHVSDAPVDYTEAMLRSIVGFEIEITAVEGKFKGSQNRSLADRTSVAAALREQGIGAADLAELVPGLDVQTDGSAGRNR